MECVTSGFIQTGGHAPLPTSTCPLGGEGGASCQATRWEELQQELSSSMVWFSVACSSMLAFLAEVSASGTGRGGAVIDYPSINDYRYLSIRN